MHRLVLVDGHNLYWRSWHGLRHSALSTEMGNPTWAVHGTFQAVASIVKRHPPDFMLIAFDKGTSKHRQALFPPYKQSRRGDGYEPPPDSRTQLETTKELLRASGVFTFQQEDTEADDILAACVKAFAREVDEVLIISGDKDVRQLIGPNVFVLSPALGGKTGKAEKVWNIAAVQEQYQGLLPQQLPEVWALSGDVTDGVPGVPGVGEKTAIKWIAKYGSLHDVAWSAEKKLEGHAHELLTNYELVLLRPNVVNIDFGLDKLKWHPVRAATPEGQEFARLLSEFDLERLNRRWRDGTLWRDVIRNRLRDRVRH